MCPTQFPAPSLSYFVEEGKGFTPLAHSLAWSQREPCYAHISCLRKPKITPRWGSLYNLFISITMGAMGHCSFWIKWATLMAEEPRVGSRAASCAVRVCSFAYHCASCCCCFCYLERCVCLCYMAALQSQFLRLLRRAISSAQLRVRPARREFARAHTARHLNTFLLPTLFYTERTQQQQPRIGTLLWKRLWRSSRSLSSSLARSRIRLDLNVVAVAPLTFNELLYFKWQQWVVNLILRVILFCALLCATFPIWQHIRLFGITKSCE
jgi:hypothetical protein